MARPGPRPRPAVVQELHGARKSRIKLEPVPLARSLTPPGYLPADARAVWDELAPQLDGLGVGHAVDSEALGVFAVLLARFRAAAVAVPGDVRVVRQLALAVRLWAGEFGFTPAARQSLGSAPGRRPVRSAERLLDP